MSANPYRGEICAELENGERILCLTLGALAELERAFDVDDLGALARKLSAGKLSAAQMIAVIGAGLRGGGNDIANDDVADMRFANGAAGMAAIVADLLQATFAPYGDDPAGEHQPNPMTPQSR